VPDSIEAVNTAVPFGTLLRDRYVAPQTAVPATSPIAGVDSADVGKTAALLKSIVETASRVPVVDQARVASLQEAIVSGAVQVNPQQIAQFFTDLEALLAQASTET
jgi:flagellar biosynthesis anti-sigma factor FlgM